VVGMKSESVVVDTSNKKHDVLELKNKLTKLESDAFYIFKCIAILCVVAAHVSKILVDNGYFTFISSTFWAMLARIGVVIFFTTSGFFFNREYNLKKKAKALIIPWIVCASLTYLVGAVLSHFQSFNIISYIQWIFGYLSWYYYVVVLIVFLLIFKFVRDSDIVLWTCIGLNIVSIVLETFSLNFITNLDFLSPFLNIFNWIGYFAAGILIKKYRLDRWFLEKKWTHFIAYFWMIVGGIAFYYFQIETDFHVITFLYKIPAILVLFLFSHFLSQRKGSKYLVEIGKNTYFIYLLHMQIVQPICSRLPIYFEVIKPIVGLTVMILLLLLLKVTFKKVLKWEKPLRFIGIQ
jgi:fucose 4-O-acetylase-like acetyltransferase